MTLTHIQQNYSEGIKGLEFFDACCWIGETSLPSFQRIRNASELKKEMTRFGILRVLVSHFASWRGHPRTGNDLLAKEIASFKGLFGCYTVLPGATNELGHVNDYLVSLVQNGKAKAFRIFPFDHHFSLSLWCIQTLFSVMQTLRFPLFVSLGQLESSWNQIRWELLYDICQAYPNLPIVVDGHGTQAFMQTRSLFALMASCRNLYLELHNFINYQGVEEIVRKFGPTRLLFGSGLPFATPGATITRIVMAGIKKTEKQLICYGNLERLVSEVRNA